MSERLIPARTRECWFLSTTSATGTRPGIVNLAIDGETAASFLNNSSPRTPPVQGRTNVPLQLENLNYNNSTALSQSQVFANTVAAPKAAGNTISTISLTLGFNELGALAPMQNTPAAEAAAITQIPARRLQPGAPGLLRRSSLVQPGAQPGRLPPARL
ncbi:MAG: hypothetical protein JO157_08705, partial [Acetobacteraceae bacterium]|nr:hypothetical protein [Acetobacteraceae bacterium]